MSHDKAKQTLSIFLPTLLPEGIDSKLERRIRDAHEKSGLYDLQLKAQTIIKSIEMSQLLGCNDVVLPVIVQEYVDLYDAFNAVKKTLTTLKAQLPVGVIDSEFKLRDCSEWLYNDLQTFKNAFDEKYPVDVAHWMEVFKSKIAKKV